MTTPLRKLSQALQAYDPESRKLLDFVQAYAQTRDGGCRIVDVGCGFGRNLKLIKAAGFEPLGVEINPATRAIVREQGLACVDPEAVMSGAHEFDIMIMSHIIEHFPPADMKEFVDSYLTHLRPGGQLIIATPLLSPYFFDDLDHVKPYLPRGILAVFGRNPQQIQYSSRNKLVLRDLWFRRGYFRVSFARSAYIASAWTRVVVLLELLSAAVFRLSFGRIGRLDGWIGVFEKTNDS